MTTKTINTNKYGNIDIRKTTDKVKAYFPFMGAYGKSYTRVAWEDTNGCYWVTVGGYWYKLYFKTDEYKADASVIGYDL